MSPPRTHSLRFRFALASLLWVGVGTLVAGLVISGLYRRHVTHTFVGDLTNHLDELANLTLPGRGRPALDRPLSDPRFEETRSGFYWQIERQGRALLRSGSLADRRLTLAKTARAHQPVWTREGAEWLLRIDRPGPYGLVFSITASGRVLEAELHAFRKDLATSLGIFACLMLAGAALQVRYGLRPTERLAEGIEALRVGRRDRLSEAVPNEFAGIVRQLNALLEAQAALVARARTEAGNLGHNLRTPLALVAGEAEQLADAEHAASAAFILDQCGRMQRQIDYQMKRAAAAGARGTGVVADLREAVAPIADALRRLHAARAVTISNQVPAGLSVACDPGDLTEILSNLLDNAFKWADSAVSVSAAAEGGWTVIRVTDDGPGIPPADRTRVLDIGVRLDPSNPGSGLGLAVSSDIATLYGGNLDLEAPLQTSGLIVILRLPRP